MEIIQVYPGAFHLPAFLTSDDQRSLVAIVEALARAPAGFYRPQVRGGGHLRCDLMCLGLHWNARRYAYEPTRSDHDGLPVPPLPSPLVTMAVRASQSVGMSLRPDVCLVTRYDSTGKMGLHQDKDATRVTLDAGVPLVSLSVGDAATFVIGGTRRREPVEAITLSSGDAFVMGGPSRLRFHGISRILPATGPAALGLGARISCTFRQYAL